MGRHIPMIRVPASSAEQVIHRLFNALDRNAIETAIDELIARLDSIDGDPDLEVSAAEDEFCPHNSAGPGCPIADPGGHGMTGHEDAEEDGLEGRQQFLDRARARACYQSQSGYRAGRHLLKAGRY